MNDDRMILHGIEKMDERESAKLIDGRPMQAVPEFAEMTIFYRNEAPTIVPKIATKLTFPCSGVMMFVDHSEEEIKLVVLNLGIGGESADVLRIELRDLPPEERTDENV